MSYAYLVVEGEADKFILSKLLPESVKDGYQFVVGQGRYSAYSLASSLLVKYGKPVALLLDTNTLDASLINEQRDSIELILRHDASGVPYKLLLAIPETEMLLTPNAHVTHSIAQRDISEFEYNLIRTSPKQFLKSLAPDTKSYPRLITEILERISDALLPELQNQEIIKCLTNFIENSVSK